MPRPLVEMGLSFSASRTQMFRYVVLPAATPLIMASLGVALGFRAGLFNIGAQGQMLIGAMCAVWVGIYLDLPAPLHILLAILAGIVGGMVCGGIAGLLKARTGAHEVITTIMFNFIALYLVQWLLSIPLFQEEGPLSLAHAFQQATDFHTRRPPGF